jgi:AraC-like DNA-binding protein
LKLFESLPSDVVIPDEKLGITCLAYIISGDARAENTLEMLIESAAQPAAFQAHSYLFLAYAKLTRYDDAFELLEKSLSRRSPIFLISYSDPLACSLKKDSRYLRYHHRLYPAISDESEKDENKQMLLDEPVAQSYTEKLLAFVDQESPYLNPELSLRSLAALIDIHPNQLSWLLNSQLQKNFNEFINHYRVAHFKMLATDPSNQHISLMGLAYESGFNSKTVFNTFFKKETGMTPSAFVKSQA